MTIKQTPKIPLLSPEKIVCRTKNRGVITPGLKAKPFQTASDDSNTGTTFIVGKTLKTFGGRAGESKLPTISSFLPKKNHRNCPESDTGALTPQLEADKENDYTLSSPRKTYPTLTIPTFPFAPSKPAKRKKAPRKTVVKKVPRQSLTDYVVAHVNHSPVRTSRVDKWTMLGLDLGEDMPAGPMPIDVISGKADIIVEEIDSGICQSWCPENTTAHIDHNGVIFEIETTDGELKSTMRSSSELVQIAAGSDADIQHAIDCDSETIIRSQDSELQFAMGSDCEVDCEVDLCSSAEEEDVLCSMEGQHFTQFSLKS